MKLRIFFAALAIAAAPIVTGCTAAQITATEARVLHDAKVVSARFTAAAVKLAAMAPGGVAAAPLARIQASDALIQAATAIGPVIMVYARTAIQAGDDLLQVMEFIPGAQPYADALRSALAVLRAVAP